MAVYADSSRIDALKTSTSVPAATASLASVPFLDRKHSYILGKWRRSSQRILRRWFGFVKTVSWSRKSSRVDDLDRKFFELRSLSDASPRRSSAYSAVGWGELENSAEFGVDIRRDRCLKIDKSWRSSSCSSPDVTTPFRSSSYGCCDADENSIHEAILYCKRSIEK